MRRHTLSVWRQPRAPPLPLRHGPSPTLLIRRPSLVSRRDANCGHLPSVSTTASPHCPSPRSAILSCTAASPSSSPSLSSFTPPPMATRPHAADCSDAVSSPRSPSPTSSLASARSSHTSLSNKPLSLSGSRLTDLDPLTPIDLSLNQQAMKAATLDHAAEAKHHRVTDVSQSELPGYQLMREPLWNKGMSSTAPLLLSSLSRLTPLTNPISRPLLYPRGARLQQPHRPPAPRHGEPPDAVWQGHEYDPVQADKHRQVSVSVHHQGPEHRLVLPPPHRQHPRPHAHSLHTHHWRRLSAVLDPLHPPRGSVHLHQAAKVDTHHAPQLALSQSRDLRRHGRLPYPRPRGFGCQRRRHLGES